MLDVTPAAAAPSDSPGDAPVRGRSLPQIPALTGLRFFAAFFILCAHAADWLGQFQNSNIVQRFGFLAMYGMPLFFVLSGFVIHYNYCRLFTSRGICMAACEFAAARFARLLPLYFCLLLMAILADGFVGRVQTQGDLWAKILAYYVTLTQSWWYIVYGNQLLINWLFPVSWSISTEMFFYITFVALVFAILALRTPRQSIMAAVFYPLVVLTSLLTVRYFLPVILTHAEPRITDYIGIDHFSDSFFRWLFYFSPYLRVFEFLMGCLTAQIFTLHLDRPVTRTERALADAALVAAFLVLGLCGACYLGFFAYGQLGPYVQFLSLNFLCAPMIAFILLYVARYDSAFTRFMSLPTLVILGDTSYSIYLIHTWTLRTFLRPAPPLTWLWAADAAFRIIGAILFTLLVSYATYHLIEVPSRAWLRRKIGRLIGVQFDDKTQPLQPQRQSEKPARQSEPVASRRGRVIFASGMIIVLVGIACLGQTARSEYVGLKVHRFWFGDRPEVSVVSATYGLNCRDFTVPAGFQKWTIPGNVTRVLKQDCDGRAQCSFVVDAGRIGDPANGCGKDFSVEYFCVTSQMPKVESRQTKAEFISAEANGKIASLTCDGLR
jgi:peptidoglycan/LPS O-acetylase OafA/YrhL